MFRPFASPTRRLATGALVLVAVVSGGLIASDHKDGPIATANPAIDIADVYAFLARALGMDWK